MDTGDEQAISMFRAQFGNEPEIVVRAPGRVNLIGGHLDYHEGFVLPLAIDRGLVLVGRRRPDRQICISSAALRLTARIEADDPRRHPTALGRYCQGAVAALHPACPIQCGCDVLVGGDLPAGAGLSSSSALVVGLAQLLVEANGGHLEPLALAQIGAEAEHWFGTTGGIMDQYVITHAQADYALFLDCRGLIHRAIRVPASVRIAVAHTGTHRRQIASPFADRRREAEAGLEVFQRANRGVKTLRDVPPDLLDAHRAELLAADPTGALWRRCRHVVTEMGRVPTAAAALEAGDLAHLGALMKEAHASLRDDYEVSSPHLEAMFDTAIDLPGCYGARMTGGGFGGCTVNLVEAEAAAAFCAQLAERYEKRTGTRPAVFQTNAASGLSTTRVAP